MDEKQPLRGSRGACPRRCAPHRPTAPHTPVRAPGRTLPRRRSRSVVGYQRRPHRNQHPPRHRSPPQSTRTPQA